MWLKQSTTINLSVGPFLDKTDGVTPETGLTPALEVAKNGGAFGARNSATAVAHDAEGFYTIELDGTDTGTLGRLQIKAIDSGTHLPVWNDFMIVPANVWDSLFGADQLKVDTVEWLGTAVTVSPTTSLPDVNAKTSPPVLQNTTLDVVTDQLNFTINAGSVDDNAYNGCTVIIEDSASSVQKAVGTVFDYVGATKKITLTTDPGVFTMASGDNISIIADRSLKPTIDNRRATISVVGQVNLLTATQASIDAIETDTGTTLDTKLNDMQGGTFSSATDSLEAIRDRGDAAWTTGSGANPTTLQNTTITGLVSQTVFNLTAGSADDDAYNGCIVVVEDSATATQKAVGIIVNYAGSTKTITLLNDPGIFIMANGDTIDVIADRSVKPATDNRTLTVSASGEVSLLAATQTSIDAIETDTANMQPKLGTPSADLAADIAAVKVDTAATLVDTADIQPKIGSPAGASVSADIADLPTVAEFNDRTIVAASYFDPAADTVVNVSTVATLTNHTAQTGDNFARLGAPAGASVSADIVAVKAETASIVTDTGTTLDTKLNDIQGGTFSSATDSLEAIRDRGDAAWTTGAGGSDRLLMVDTTIATLASQTSFTLTAGSADDDAYNNCTIVIEDVSTATQKAIGIISDYTGSTKTVTLLNDPGIFTMTTTDKIYILAEKGLKPTIDNRTLAISASGEVDLLAATQTSIDAIETDTANMQPKLGSPAADLAADIAAVKVDTAATLIDTANMQPKLGSPAADLAADIAAVKVDTAATLVDTSVIGAGGAGLTDLGGMSTGMKAEVNAEMVDVESVDIITQPGQETPAANQTRDKMMAHLYKIGRNKVEQNASEVKIYNDDTTTVDQKATVSDDGTTYTRGEFTTGP